MLCFLPLFEYADGDAFIFFKYLPLIRYFCYLELRLGCCFVVCFFYVNGVFIGIRFIEALLPRFNWTNLIAVILALTLFMVSTYCMWFSWVGGLLYAKWLFLFINHLAKPRFSLICRVYINISFSKGFVGSVFLWNFLFYSSRFWRHSSLCHCLLTWLPMFSYS